LYFEIVRLQAAPTIGRTVFVTIYYFVTIY